MTKGDEYISRTTEADDLPTKETRLAKKSSRGL